MPLDAAYGPAEGGEEEQAGAGQPHHQGEQGGGAAGRAGGRLDAALCRAHGEGGGEEEGGLLPVGEGEGGPDLMVLVPEQNKQTN